MSDATGPDDADFLDDDDNEILCPECDGMGFVEHDGEGQTDCLECDGCGTISK